MCGLLTFHILVEYFLVIGTFLKVGCGFFCFVVKPVSKVSIFFVAAMGYENLFLPGFFYPCFSRCVTILFKKYYIIHQVPNEEKTSGAFSPRFLYDVPPPGKNAISFTSWELGNKVVFDRLRVSLRVRKFLFNYSKPLL